MAYFAKIVDSKVSDVIAVADEDCLKPNGEHSEEVGRKFCENLTNYPNWKQTSYNTNEGKYYKAGMTGGKVDENLHEDQSKAFRYNYASIGYSYNEYYDAFIRPKPFPSWILNKTKMIWEAPTPCPEDDNWYKWNELTENWENQGAKPSQPE